MATILTSSRHARISHLARPLGNLREPMLALGGLAVIFLFHTFLATLSAFSRRSWLRWVILSVLRWKLRADRRQIVTQSRLQQFSFSRHLLRKISALANVFRQIEQRGTIVFVEIDQLEVTQSDG